MVKREKRHGVSILGEEEGMKVGVYIYSLVYSVPKYVFPAHKEAQYSLVMFLTEIASLRALPVGGCEVKRQFRFR